MVSKLMLWVHLNSSMCRHGIVSHLSYTSLMCRPRHTPFRFNSGVLWLMSRMLPSSLQELLQTSAKEAADNTDEMSNAPPGKTAALLTIWPFT